LLSALKMMSQPGFFSFRWQPEKPGAGAEDIAVVFKVPGAIDLSVLPDLLESVCLGPVVPSAVAILQFGEDGLVEALNAAPTKNALARFNGRMPLLVFTIQPAPYSVSLVMALEASASLQRELTTKFMSASSWTRAGLATIFDPKVVVVTAPAGYAFRKPSSDRSTYFIRAELALSTSAAVSFVAFAILQRLVQGYGKIPQDLRLLLVDTMNVAATAFALREMLSLAGARPVPQVESFHSYGGLDEVANPLPDTSLCIVSASSSMNLHRKWLREKALSSRDIVTLVTFEDAEDAQHALYGLPVEARPEESPPSSAYDIRIAGEYFFPVMEPPRKVLLTTTHHGCQEFTKDFHLLRERQLFGAFRAAAASGTRRSLFIDADALLKAEEFQCWINAKVPQLLKAGTAQIVFQDDKASAILAQHVAYIATTLGCTGVKVCNAKEVDASTVDRTAPIVCVSAVVGRGNALLALSRDLRNCHIGARLFVIGMQVSESVAKLDTFDRNLKHSSHKSPIEVLRRNVLLCADTVTESFQQELALYPAPGELSERQDSLLRGPEATQLFLPSGPQLLDALVLNEDFAFWDGKYVPSAYHAEVLGTISAVLQNARTSKLRLSGQQLRSPLLMHVALDPENFARFNEGIIQAALLRAAQPSELDYRGDVSASAYMAVLLSRVAARFDHPQIATLEFLVAIATKRMQLNVDDTAVVRVAFEQVTRSRSDPMSRAVRFLLDAFPSPNRSRQAF
jgi:hypothetical protein